MNKLYSYLSTRLGKKTCPIKSIEISFNFNHNDPFKQTLIITYEDGSKEEFIEKPKTKNDSNR